MSTSYVTVFIMGIIESFYNFSNSLYLNPIEPNGKVPIQLYLFRIIIRQLHKLIMNILSIIVCHMLHKRFPILKAIIVQLQIALGINSIAHYVHLFRSVSIVSIKY